MGITKQARRGLAVFATGALGAGLLVGSGAAPASAAANLVLDYTCTYPLINQQDLAVDITVDLPTTAEAGVPTAPFDIEAISTVSANTTSGLTLIGAKTIEGTAVSHVNVQAPQVNLPDIQVPVTVPQTPIPASGAFDITATGQTPSLTFPETGQATIDVGDLDLRMFARNSSGEPIALPGGNPDGSFNAPCTANPGQDQRLATFDIVDASMPTCNGLTATITGSGRIVGTPGDDVIVGSSEDDLIVGRGGDDVICAGAGDDRIAQRSAPDGADLIDGEAGIDTISYAKRTTPVVVTLSGTAADDGAADEGDSVRGVENAIGGSGDDRLTGSAVANRLVGREGNDIISGLAGDDTELGGEGDDTFKQGAVANGADVLVGQGGLDTVDYGSRTAAVDVTLRASATANDGAAGEGDSARQVENVTGGSGDDTLIGSAKANVIVAGAGDDTLQLRDRVNGNDSGDGGPGTDTATSDTGDTITNVP